MKLYIALVESKEGLILGPALVMTNKERFDRTASQAGVNRWSFNDRVRTFEVEATELAQEEEKAKDDGEGATDAG